MSCDPSKPTSTYTGYEVEVFRAVAAGLGWLEAPTRDIQLNSTSFYFQCTTSGSVPDAINTLIGDASTANEAAGDSSCAVVAGRSWSSFPHLSKDANYLLLAPLNTLRLTQSSISAVHPPCVTHLLRLTVMFPIYMHDCATLEHSVAHISAFSPPSLV